MLAFGGGHIEGALNIAASPILSIWVGWFLIRETHLLVLDSDDDVEKVAQLFVRRLQFAGYLSAECAPGRTPLSLPRIAADDREL